MYQICTGLSFTILNCVKCSKRYIWSPYGIFGVWWLYVNRINFSPENHLRVPDIHEAQKHWFFTFCLIFLSNHYVSKIWMILFWPRVDRWEKWSQNGKMPPGGRVEIENIRYAKSDILNFNSTTRWRFWTLTPLFQSMECWPKKDHSDFW